MSARQRTLKVRKLPTSCVFSWLAALSNVLILAREELVAVLLGLMVELRGSQPIFLGREESLEGAIRRESFDAVVIDCDHPDCTERLLDAIRNTGAEPILFSPFRLQSEVLEVATRHGTRSFTLPTDPDTFGKMLQA
jgi:hypothetical protein